MCAISKCSYVVTRSWPTLNLFRDVWCQKIIIKRRRNSETISFYGGKLAGVGLCFMSQGGAIFIKYCVRRFLSSLFRPFYYNSGALETMKCQLLMVEKFFFLTHKILGLRATGRRS